MSANTEIEICFFKPEGVADRWVVAGTDRGAAMRAVLDWYENQRVPMTVFINYITARRTSSEPTFPPVEK